MQRNNQEEPVFVIETCQNCKAHYWNTRHDEAKYIEYTNKITAAIIQRVPHASVMRNQIPKSYLPYDLYCNLIPNNDTKSAAFAQVPRVGAFEVSFKGLLIFSKLQGGYWPNVQLCASKCEAIIEADSNGDDVSPFLATGSIGKKRSGSPTKHNKSMTSTAKKENVTVAQVDEADVKPFKVCESEKFLQPMEKDDDVESVQPIKPVEQEEPEKDEPVMEQPEKAQEDVEDKKEEITKVESKQALEESPAAVKEETPAKAKEETPEKAKEETPAQAKEETPAKAKEETPAKAKEETPAKAQEEEAVAEVKCGSHLKDADDLTGFPVFPEGTKSSLSRHLTRAIWEELHDKKDSEGVSFKTCVLSGCQNVDSGIGCYAGSHKGYSEFSSLFDPVILEYHGHKKDDKHNSNMDASKLNCPPFAEEDAKMIKSTRIRVGRNLAKFPLGPGISKEQRDQVEVDAQKAFESFKGELAGKYYPLATMSEADQKQLIEDHFLFKEGDRFLQACGLNRDWPSGRGIFHNDEKTFLCWVNEEDQFRIISMEKGADIGAVFKRLSTAAACIGEVAEFAHDDHLGYITSCPTNLGTALRASVHIHLPLLGAKKDAFQAIADKFFVQIRGAHGEHTETNDMIFDISNIRRLGRSEVELVQDMYDGVKAMIEAEKALRPAEASEEPKKEETVDVVDDKKEETPAIVDEKKEEAPAAEAQPQVEDKQE